jgi:hypothetical protein
MLDLIHLAKGVREKGNKMELLTKELRKKLPALYANEEVTDPMIIAKFFALGSGWTWFAMEFDGEDIFFGMVHGFEKELGYFSLKELQSLKLSMGGIEIPAVERDINWTPRRLSELKEYA